MKLKEETGEIFDMRGKCKEIINYQIKVLQFHEASRNNFFSYLKVLLDMAEIYQMLQYYHNANELLNIVEEEL